jgi:hypothetical protein
MMVTNREINDGEIIIKSKTKRTNHNLQNYNQQPTMGRPRGSKNVMSCHKAGGDRRSVQYKGQRMENKKKEQKARQDWMNRMASSRQGTGMSKEFVPHPASEELLKKAQELLQLVMAHPSTPKSRNLPDFINMDDKSPNDDQIDYDSDNDENDDETSKKYWRSYMPPEGSILFHYLEGVKDRVRKGELIDMAKGQKSIPANEDPVAVGLKSRPVPDIFYKNVYVEVWAPMEQFKNKCHT